MGWSSFETAVVLEEDWWPGIESRDHSQQHENETVNDRLRVRRWKCDRQMVKVTIGFFGLTVQQQL